MCSPNNDLDLRKCNILKHNIKIIDPQPFKEMYRRIPSHLYEEVKAHLQEMVEVGAIRRSFSSWASAVVLVREKDGELRFCIDLRKLNNRTIKDGYSLPRIEDTLDCLHGAVWFSTLDLKSGYWQVELEEEAKPLTAFTVGPLGFWECEHMPFGLTNAPVTFQRLMESCLSELHLNWCIIYLDDIIVFSRTPEEHLHRLKSVFNKLEAAGLKLKPSTCDLFKQQINYLGHVVSQEGVSTDPEKIKVRSFLGFVSYYRRFIPNFSKVATPINKLLQNVEGKPSQKKKFKVCWGPEQQEAFETLQRLCTESPILAYADFKAPIVLHTDASGDGLGVVLYQVHDGWKRVIAYASRSLSKSERNYPVHKLEFLTLKWAIADKFHECLYGSEFQVYTENNRYRTFIKGFVCIAQPLGEYLTVEGASGKLEWVWLTKDALEAFEVLKWVCMTAPILVFVDYTKLFLLETDVSKDGLWVVLSQKQADRQYHPIAYGKKTLMPHEKNYHLIKLKFMALKWAVTKHFKEYLPYQSFVVWTDNNLLTFIMSTPNLDATGLWWVGALTWFNFKLEYQKGCDNSVADVLSWVTTWMNSETMKSILDGVTLGMVHWTKVHDLVVLEGD